MKEPYKLLFPLGVIFGILGVSVWIASALSPGYGYPSQMHSQLMVGSFLFAFAAGFLMTAIPKMTASFPAQSWELVGLCGLTLGNTLSAITSSPELFFYSNTLAFLALVAFFARRFQNRTKPIPPFFPFVLFGLAAGMSGALMLGISQRFEIPAFYILFGRKLFFEGMTLSLVLGIGSRLIPVISGRGNLDAPGYKPVLMNILLAALLVGSYALQGFGFDLAAGLIKVAVVSWVGIFNWGLTRRSQTKSRLALGMRLSGMMVILGVILSLVQPGLAVNWMHLTYISGFGLMTLTVASRVTLAHGSYDLAFETRSKALWICGALILTAALARIAAPFSGVSYSLHLAYAASAWILAMGIWAMVFVKRMYSEGELAQPGC